MLARGGRMAVALLSKRLTVQERPIAMTSSFPWNFLSSCRVTGLDKHDASRRDFSTEVMSGPVNDEQRRILLNRILYRSKQRGYLELDLLLGTWAQDNISRLDEKQLGALVEVLDEENPDLWKWLSGQDQIPEKFQSNPVFTAIHKKVQDRLQKHASEETRAKPGLPWVRGWDDIGKGGSPKLGINYAL
ncbi:hypothetical protein R1flu_023255 [Riccia fluitans]|uniref:Succinate dehydrogenase assembly factor 2, mitochondrial n=1 Tax=Riccia fluitans TaxID=41844 RepID=A0ABD1XVM1_9MARC